MFRYNFLFLTFILFGVLWVSQIGGLVSVINLGKFSAIITSDILFSAPLSLCSPSGISVRHMFYFLCVPKVLDVLGFGGGIFVCSFFFPHSSFHFSLGPIFRLTDSFLAMSSLLLMSPLKAFFFSVNCVIWSVLIWFFGVLSLCLFICSYMLSTFFIRALSLLIIVNSHFLSHNSNICVIRYCSDGCSFLQTVCGVFFPCLLAYLIICCWKLGILFQVMETEVNRALVWGFMLIQGGTGLCLMFIIAVDTRGFIFPCCTWFFGFSSWLWNFPIFCSSESVSYSSFTCNPLLLSLSLIVWC